MLGDEHHPVTLRWLNRRLLIVVVVVAFTTAALVALGTVALVQSQTNRSLRSSAVNGCDGSNLLRGYARLATHGNQPRPPDDRNLADWLLRIRDCGATYDQGRIVTIGVPQEVAFLAALAAHRRVAVRDGGRRLVAIP